MAVQSVKIALTGNPNVGKSTLFNALTGSRQHVGNWPGKTVEKKEGRLRLDGLDVVVVDLPGTYSLTAFSAEEVISRDFIIHEQPGAVIAVVDAANLERNLYLVTQVLELEVPVILVLNMSDIARKRGLTIHAAQLSTRLDGMPVIETVGSSGVGLDALKAAILQAAGQHQSGTICIPYEDALEREIALLGTAVEAEPALMALYRPRWLAIKLLEADEDIRERLAAYPSLLEDGAAAAARIEDETGEDAETLITDGRYSFINRIVAGSLSRPREALETTSDKLDRVLTHRIWGLPIFLLLMWVVFQFTANVSAPFLDWVDFVVTGPVTNAVTALLGTLGLGGTWVASLIVNGMIAGVGGVLVFVPVLIFLYLAIGILEDSGYMARAAFVMDRVMRLMGLHGKSFLPMLVGFGCTVPAVYATRTLENEGDRKLTGFLVTFMSCGARLPVYVVMGAAFFGAQSGNLIFAMYLLGIVVALVTGWLMKRTVYRNKPPQPFVMELPPYRAPRLRGVWRQTWERTSGFVRKAATIILATSVVIWLLMAIPVRGTGSFNDVPAADSVFGAVSEAVSPVFAPAGFGNWQATGSLITGFVAKEVIVGTMSQIFVGEAEPAAPDEPVPTISEDMAMIGTSFVEAALLTVQETVNIVPRTINLIPGMRVPEADVLGTAGEAEDTTALEGALQQVFTPLSAVAFTVFVLLYTPCMVTVAAMRHEFGTRFMAIQIVYTLVVAWMAAVLVFQVGTIFGLLGG
ncbi:MAG TPA: ferrous iron transport protein B [Candidatus Limnocylindrales bacterium]|nr:ferrous iron transport protein B [Candidatus Limnocylindrales bacterium]